MELCRLQDYDLTKIDIEKQKMIRVPSVISSHRCIVSYDIIKQVRNGDVLSKQKLTHSRNIAESIPNSYLNHLN